MDQIQRFQPAHAGRSPSHWDGLASTFSRLAERTDPGNDPVLSLVRKRISPEKTLLDVGAGAGRYAVHLAPHVRQVIAVEPSAGMRAALAEQVAKRELSNVTVVAGAWQEADVDPADVVLAANVLYWTADIAPFLRKLLAHARERCLIVQRATQSSAAFAPLWEELWGEPQAPQPDFQDLYNVLFQLGAKPDARLFQTAHHRWSSLEEAIDRATRELLIPEDHPSRARVRQFVEATAVLRDGYWTDPNPTWIGVADVPATS